MGAIADRTQASRFGVVLIVDFRGILVQQDPLVFSDGLAALSYMRGDQLLIGDIRRLQEAIGGFEGGLVV